MKKLLSIVLALVLLTASAAFAETATVLTYSNPVITVTSEGQTNTADLTGLTATVSLGLVGEAPAEDDYEAEDTRVPTVLLDIDKEGEVLLSAEAQFIDNRLILSVDGLSRPIALDLSAAGDTAVEGYRTLFAALPELAKAELPAFTGVNIPKLDLLSGVQLLSFVGIQVDATEQTAAFEIPAELVNYLVQAVVSQIPAEALEATGLNELLANGGFALKGSVTDDGATASLVVDILAAEDGATAADPIVELAFTSADNQDNLTVDLFVEGQILTLGTLALTSIPDAAELNLALDILDGVVGLGFSLYPQDGAQVAALVATADDQRLTGSLTYGKKDGADYADFALVVDGQAAVDSYVETVADGNGNENGTSVITLDVYADPQSNVVIASDIAQTIVDGYSFRNIDNAGSAIDAANMTEEEAAQLEQELDNAVGKLLGYLGEIAPAA